MRRLSFVFQNVSYDLGHLENFIHTFVVSATKFHPERHYFVHVEFSDHCFTANEDLGDEATLFYCFEKKGGHVINRMFNLTRWNLSKYLPSIVKGLLGRHIMFTNGTNFFTVELMTDAGLSVEYQVYFKAIRIAQNRLRLIVESAYPYDENAQKVIKLVSRLFYAMSMTKNRFTNRIFNKNKLL
jgi:hypothetical protein